MKLKGVLLILFLSTIAIVSVQPLVILHLVDSSHGEVDSVDEIGISQISQKAIRGQFFENIGQIDNSEVHFNGRIPRGMVGFAESKVLLWMDGMEDSLALSFEGANVVAPRGVDEVSHQTNYFLGDRGTFTGVRGFSRVAYDDLWPGIGLIYHATVDGAKYEFRVGPGADPNDIRVRCEGHDSLVIGTSSVWVEKDEGALVDEGLKVLQEGVEIEAEFVQCGPHTYGIEVGDYDRSETLVIDSLSYSNSEGKSDGGESIVVDSSGNAYVTGYTDTSDFPTTNAYNSTYGENTDCFVFKLSANGSTLLYSTFVGGSDYERGRSIAVDSSGNAYVTGRTYSDNFPTANAYNSTYGGNGDCFVFKLSPDGSELLYSTFISGRDDDSGTSIVVDSSGNAYVTGRTWSEDIPTANAYNSTHGGNADCFVFKLSPDGSELLYSTFVGGWDDDRGRSIAVDLSGNAYVTGYTDTSDFPTTNAYNSTYGNNTDCFVFKLSANGSTLLYSTFVGGGDDDRGRSIAVDSSGNAYVTGRTYSDNFPTANAYDILYNGNGDCFVFKLSANGSTLLYSTFVGGWDDDNGRSIAVDSSGNAYVTGRTWSWDFPRANAYDILYNENGDCFVFKLSANGSTLLYSTFVGGGEIDRGRSIAVDSSGNAYVTGNTRSWDFPTVNAYDSSYKRTRDCFVFKLSPDGSELLYSTFVGGTTITTTTTQTLDMFIVLVIIVAGYTFIAGIILTIVVEMRRKRTPRYGQS